MNKHPKIKALVLLGIVLSSWNVYAQGDVPPPLNPFDSPWPTPGAENAPMAVPPTAPPGTAPAEAVPAAPPFNDESSGSAGFDPFEEDDSDMGGGGGSRAPRKSEGKQSFMLLEPAENQSCARWVNKLDGDVVFEDQDACLSSLEKKAKTSKESISKNEDSMERAKIKSVIKGEVSRDQSKSFKVTFDKIRASIESALKKKCTCAK